MAAMTSAFGAKDNALGVVLLSDPPHPQSPVKTPVSTTRPRLATERFSCISFLLSQYAAEQLRPKACDT
jgi:hypothetical protein